jgi:hypothetical protein
MQAMANRVTLSCCLLVASLSCRKTEPSKPAAPVQQPVAKPTAREAPAAPARPAVPDEAAAKALLTEDKIARYIVYQTEMLPTTQAAMKMGMRAFEKVGTDQKKIAKEVTADSGYAKIATAGRAALEKSGLTEKEMTTLARVLSPYVAALLTAELFSKKPKDQAAKPGEAKPNPRLEQARKDFAEKYGTAALEVVKKHEPEFVEINKNIMGQAFGAMADKKK